MTKTKAVRVRKGGELSWLRCYPSDTYDDGRCAGSAIGLVDAGGMIRRLERLSMNCKVEGIAASVAGETIDLLLVTDADNRHQPALLLSAALHR